MPKTSTTTRDDYCRPTLRRRARLAQVAAVDAPSPVPPSIKSISGLIFQSTDS